MRKSTIWMLCAVVCLTFFGGGLVRVAEARADVHVAEREMKKSRDYQSSSLYERARRIIYGQNPPTGPEGRVRIAIVIDGDEGLIVEERVKDEIYQQLRKKFPREEFALMKGTDITTKLLQYAEETHNNSRTLDKDGLAIPTQQPNNLSYVTREDFIRAGRDCDYDFIFAVTVSHGGYYQESHNFIIYSSTTYKKMVWLRVRFVDVANGNYLYRRDIVAYGKTGGHRGRARIFQQGVREAMREALDDIEVKY